MSNFRKSRLIDTLSEIFGFPRRYDNSIVEAEFNCPKCDKGNNKFNLGVNLEKHLFHCWSCEYRGSVLKLIRDYGTGRQLSEYDPTKSKIKVKEKSSSSHISTSGFRSLKVEWKDSLVYPAAIKYLRKRGITGDLIKKWDMCYCESGTYANRVIIPSKTEEGVLEYFAARDIFGTSNRKYMFPPIEKNDFIFGEKFVNWKSPVVLTEGVFDSIVAFNAVPILGVDISGCKKLLRKLFENKTPVIMVLDSDEAGREGTIKTASILKNLGIRLYVVDSGEYKDMALAYEKSGTDGVLKMIESARPYDCFEYTLERFLGGK